MNLEYFLATRVAQSGKQSFSRLIIRIAILAIALSITVMIVATALIRGFKHEISNKIFGFWGHVHIPDTSTANLTNEEAPVDINQDFYPSMDTIRQVKYLAYKKILGHQLDKKVEKMTNGGIRHIQVYANRPGIIKTKKEIEGIIVKGIGKDFDWQYLNQFLQKGRPLNLTDSTMSREIIISELTANRLNLKIGDSFTIYFVKKGSQAPRKFKLVGIYRTGLAEYDKVIALVDIRQVQHLRGWSENQVGGFEVFLDDIDDMEVLT
ncbi:MAG TPA: ABC transporter permease, partial [Phaeodactylibacter sp.]|nr:ABC transporter permease [Phaeodactylibacter sp.]